MKIDRFYVAYAIRHWVSHNDIFDFEFTYEAANERAENQLVDDDDAGVFVSVDGKWYRVWGRDNLSQALVVSAEYDGWNKAYVSEWY